MIRWFVALIVVCGLLSAGTAFAEDIVKLKIKLYTDQDDKDDDEDVTIEIIRSSDGKIIGTGKYGQGQTWKDQTEQSLDLTLKNLMPSQDKNKYKIKISKSCANGYPNGKGWHFCV